ncbi:MAG TPA: hypothetical protein VFL54_10615, partial [Gammaproteobacteria bacterium]|nr:hypothetical protein [Gammaproteobacteria bacterium]
GRSTAFLQKYRTENQVILLNDDEILESFALAAQYRALFDFVGAAKVEFNPIIRGAGFLGVCSADLSIDDTLYEVKTVSRKITGRDIRQLMVYLALQYSTGIRRWISAGFFNPRKSLHYKFSIEHLIYRTSGGRAVPDVFGAIIDFLSTRGVEIDTEF